MAEVNTVPNKVLGNFVMVLPCLLWLITVVGEVIRTNQCLLGETSLSSDSSYPLLFLWFLVRELVESFLLSFSGRIQAPGDDTMLTHLAISWYKPEYQLILHLTLTRSLLRPQKEQLTRICLHTITNKYNIVENVEKKANVSLNFQNKKEKSQGANNIGMRKQI